METNVAAPIVRSVAPEIPLAVAVIVADPMATAVANPLVPPVLLTEPFEESADDQAALDVRSRVDESVYVPVAVNC